MCVCVSVCECDCPKMFLFLTEIGKACETRNPFQTLFVCKKIFHFISHISYRRVLHNQCFIRLGK